MRPTFFRATERQGYRNGRDLEPILPTTLCSLTQNNNKIIPSLYQNLSILGTNNFDILVGIF